MPGQINMISTKKLLENWESHLTSLLDTNGKVLCEIKGIMGYSRAAIQRCFLLKILLKISQIS